jgi:hypothetical protein
MPARSATEGTAGAASFTAENAALGIVQMDQTGGTPTILFAAASEVRMG